MATVVVLADPPREGLALPGLVESSPLSSGDAADLYAAMLRDAVVATQDSGGDPLVNYRPDDLLPEAARRDVTAEAAVRAAVDDALTAPDDVRFEEQVGSTRSGRVGNTVTHLLEREGANGVVVVDPAAPLVGRTAVDQAAMKLRSSEVVLAPSTGGRIALAGFTETLDFEDALIPPAVETLTARAGDADVDVDFLPLELTVEAGGDLASLLSLLRARVDAGRHVPTFTAEAVADLGLTVEVEAGVPVVRRE